MITIFTPTYNRAHTLPRLYESLKKQNCKKFEWIIIDDDSNDNTEELIDNYKLENNTFNISYIKQQHGGKHRAINKAVNIAKFEWFFIVDSDDYLSEDAVEKILIWINENKDDPKVGAVSGSRFNLAINKAMSVPSLLQLNPGIKCLNYERSNYNLDCDKAEIYRTEILKVHPFPEYEGEFFCTEAVCWDSIAYDGYYISFYPDSIYMCEYLDDGLTKNGANTYKGFSNNLYGFLDYVDIELKCLGFCDYTYGLLNCAIKIIKEKKLSTEILFNKINKTEKELNSFLKSKKKNIIQKVVNKINILINGD